MLQMLQTDPILWLLLLFRLFHMHFLHIILGAAQDKAYGMHRD